MGAADLLQHARTAGFTLESAANKLLVSPASMLSDELRTSLLACKPELLALLDTERAADAEAFEERAAIMEFDGGLLRADAEAAARKCVDCKHFTRRRTCLEPVAAGLRTQAEGFGIAWPALGPAHTAQADRCPGFKTQEALT